MSGSAIPAVAAGPIEYTDPDTGELTIVPVDAISYNSSGTLTIDAAFTSPPALFTWLNYLVTSGAVTQAAVPLPAPAFTIKAATPSPQGVITVTVSNVTPSKTAPLDPTQTTFTLSVTETDIYAGLTLATIMGVLGSDLGPGSAPGLVSIAGKNVPTALPAQLSKTALTVAAKASQASLAVTDGASPANTVFTLNAKTVASDPTSTADGANITVAITKPDAEGAFTLTAVCTIAATGVTLATIGSALTTLAYLITGVPASTGVFPFPAAGAYTLTGGTLSSPASAVIPAGS